MDITSACNYFIGKPQNGPCRRCGGGWEQHYPKRQHALADMADAEIVAEEAPADDHGDVDSQGSLFGALTWKI